MSYDLVITVDAWTSLLLFHQRIWMLMEKIESNKKWPQWLTGTDFERSLKSFVCFFSDHWQIQHICYQYSCIVFMQNPYHMTEKIAKDDDKEQKKTPLSTSTVSKMIKKKKWCQSVFKKGHASSVLKGGGGWEGRAANGGKGRRSVCVLLKVVPSIFLSPLIDRWQSRSSLSSLIALCGSGALLSS